MSPPFLSALSFTIQLLGVVFPRKTRLFESAQKLSGINTLLTVFKDPENVCKIVLRFEKNSFSCSNKQTGTYLSIN
jgi:hypothetical protein